MRRSLRRSMRASRRAARLWSALGILALAPAAVPAQDRGAARLHELVNGLTVTPRVLIIGAHPDDVDPQLIAWLARGHLIETGYLSLTRGEAGDNFIGTESGISLGAIRTEESLAARRIDGGESFFTRAFDFGPAKNAEMVFKRWSKPALLVDLVSIVRSFRPQVIVSVFSDTLHDGNAQHAASAILAREVFDAAADGMTYPSKMLGKPWTPLKLYGPGSGVSIDASAFDAVLGATYAELARESRAQHRSQGLFDVATPPRRGSTIVSLRRLASRVNETTPPDSETSIFDGIDTTFARLSDSASAPRGVAPLLPVLAAYADSARGVLDLAHPASAVGYLGQVAKLAAAARAATPWCQHPSRDAAPPAGEGEPCEARWLDLDASIDLVRRRAIDALLAAAQVTIEATTDRDLIAETDTVYAAVRVANHGAAPIELSDVSLSGAVDRNQRSLIIPPDSAARVVSSIAGLAESRPWWVGPRKNNMFDAVRSSVDGIQRTSGIMLAPLIVPGIVIPEELRRASDASVTLTIAGATVATSVGPIMHRVADAQLGMQEHPVGAVPAATLAFERGLEWLPARTPITRQLRLAVKSFADFPQTFALKVVSPPSIHVDRLPDSVTLAPHEERELFLQLRGALPSGRYEFGIVGEGRKTGRLLEGIQPLRYSHIPPVNYYHSSALYLQAVDINVPPRLMVAYVPGVRDDLWAMLRQLGVPGVPIDAADLLSVDLSNFTTLVIGPRAYEAHAELSAQNARLLDFVRKGGTMVVLGGQYATTTSSVLAYPAVLSQPAPEHVTVADAPVTVLDSTARLLKWPNAIRPVDWDNWVRERALFVPTAVDSHYSRLLEMHDPGEKDNKNSLLVTTLGKGTYIYTTLTFFEQLPGGVPGSARLLVNLLSAGCRSSGCPGVARSAP